MACVPNDVSKTNNTAIADATFQPVFSRIAGGDAKFHSVLPYTTFASTTTPNRHVNFSGTGGWLESWAKDNHPNGTNWMAMFDAGDDVFSETNADESTDTKPATSGKPVCAISFPINALDTSSPLKETKRIGNEIHSKKLRFKYNIRITDASSEGLNHSYINRSLQIVTVHMYLLKIPVNGPNVHEIYSAMIRDWSAIWLETGPPAIAQNTFPRSFVENMFEDNPLLMDSRKQLDFTKLKLRRGTHSDVLLNDEGQNDSLKTVWNWSDTWRTHYADPFLATDAPGKNSHYSRAYPFKVLAHKTHRLGSHGVSDILAHYEVEDMFELKLGKEYFIDPDGIIPANGKAPNGSKLAPYCFRDHAYVVMMLHNGAMYSGFPTAEPSATAETSWQDYGASTPTPYKADHAARVWCKTEIEHFFTSM